MKRREFVTGAALLAGLSACAQEELEQANRRSGSTEKFEWNMTTSWPPHLPGLGVGADNLAKNIEIASNGRLKIKVYAGGELVPPLEVFDAVSQGTVHMGHDSSYYHRGKTLEKGVKYNATNGLMIKPIREISKSRLQLEREKFPFVFSSK